jgi:penicillin-binding protein 2
LAKDKKKKFDRYISMMLIMCILFALLASRLVYLQVVKAEEFTEKANNKSITELFDFAPRGEILDKNGTLLATNKQTHMVTYNELEQNNASFIETMIKLFRILDENKEEEKDDFPIIFDTANNNKLKFHFNSEAANTRRWMELRFKKDRGFEDEVIKKLFGSIKEELNDEQKKQVDEELLKITAEEAFNKLLERYKIDDIKSPKFSMKIQRRIMVVKDKTKMQSYSKYKPVVVANNVKRETAFTIMQQLNDLPGVDIDMQPVRTYPYNELGSAFLGYISKVPSWKQAQYEESGYDVSTDYIGMSGIESVFEDRLKGSKGSRIVKINKYGRVTSELGQKESYPGQNIQLTIDKDVQIVAEKALDETMEQLQKMGRVRDVDMSNATRGAAVAIDVKTGSIIALASRPGYNPNFFVEPGGLSSEKYNEYFSLDLEKAAKKKGYTPDEIEKLFPIDKSIENNTTIRQDKYDILPKPVYNYATMAAVPPGSVFKPITAVAGLETGVISARDSIFDNGTFNDGNNFIKHFAVGGYGRIDLSKALAVSSNPFFMNVGKLLRDKHGDDILAEYAWKLGLGLKSSTGIEIPERYGQMFNSKALEDLFATSYLWTTMEMLKSGHDARGNTFPYIDLYDNKMKDSKVLAEVKTNFKKQIQQSIKTGDMAIETYKNLLSELIVADPQYKKSNYDKKTIDSVVGAIIGVTVYDAHSQLKIGANMYNASIGQGVSSFTPIQMANSIATLVNGGKRYELHLVDKIISPEGDIIEEKKPKVLEEVKLKSSTVEAVKEGMYEVNYYRRGTAYNVFKDFPIISGGKTGSATFSNKQEEIGRTSYGWYVGFAPYDKPEIAVAVVIFDGGHGSYVAPVAKAIYEEYFKEELSKLDYKKEDIKIQGGSSD